MKKEYRYWVCQDCGEKYNILHWHITNEKVCEECGSKKICEVWDYEKEVKE